MKTTLRVAAIGLITLLALEPWTARAQSPAGLNADLADAIGDLPLPGLDPF